MDYPISTMGKRSDYLALSPEELALASGRPGLHSQIYCALQIGYFKAKRAFFHFTWDDVREDCGFVLTRYFNGRRFQARAISKRERYAQRAMIAELFGYRLWSATFSPQLAQRIAQIIRRDVTPGFIVAELIAYLNEHKIVRPGYTTLQTLIGEALSAERRRLGDLLAAALDEPARNAFAQLLLREETLSGISRSQAGRQGLRLATDGTRTGEARQVGVALPDSQGSSAQARDLTAEYSLLRGPG